MHSEEMQFRRNRVTVSGVLSILVGYGLQWLSTHFAYQSVANIGQDAGAFVRVATQGPRFGLLLSLGTHLTYLGYALILIVVYVSLTQPIKPAGD